jgi:hypothetical protein
VDLDVEDEDEDDGEELDPTMVRAFRGIIEDAVRSLRRSESDKIGRNAKRVDVADWSTSFPIQRRNTSESTLFPIVLAFVASSAPSKVDRISESRSIAQSCAGIRWRRLETHLGVGWTRESERRAAEWAEDWNVGEEVDEIVGTISAFLAKRRAENWS